MFDHYMLKALLLHWHVLPWAVNLSAASQLDWSNVYIFTGNMSRLCMCCVPLMPCCYKIGWTGVSHLEGHIHGQLLEGNTHIHRHRHKITRTVVSEVGSSPHQIRSQSFISHSLHDVITTEQGHMDGMRRSVPFELNGKAPSVLLMLWSGVRMNSCMIFNSHPPQMILMCNKPWYCGTE